MYLRPLFGNNQNQDYNKIEIDNKYVPELQVTRLTKSISTVSVQKKSTHKQKPALETLEDKYQNLKKLHKALLATLKINNMKKKCVFGVYTDDILL